MKKAKNKKVETNIENNILAEVKPSTNNIGYLGTINVRIQHNGKFIKNNTYHNAGSIQLFEFLSKCITGQYSDNLVPKFIRLFTFDTAPSEIPTGITGNAIGPAIAFNTCTITKADSETNPTANAILHFTISGSSLSSSNTDIKIYQAGLYNSNNTETKANYSAAFNFVNGTTWTPLSFNLANGEYNIYVEWTLTFSNASN